MCICMKSAVKMGCPVTMEIEHSSEISKQHSSAGHTQQSSAVHRVATVAAECLEPLQNGRSLQLVAESREHCTDGVSPDMILALGMLHWE